MEKLPIINIMINLFYIVNNFDIFIIIYSKCARPFEKQTPERLP
jgi:hypothetical protein